MNTSSIENPTKYEFLGETVTETLFLHYFPLKITLRSSTILMLSSNTLMIISPFMYAFSSTHFVQNPTNFQHFSPKKVHQNNPRSVLARNILLTAGFNPPWVFITHLPPNHRFTYRTRFRAFKPRFQVTNVPKNTTTHQLRKKRSDTISYTNRVYLLFITKLVTRSTQLLQHIRLIFKVFRQPLLANHFIVLKFHTFSLIHSNPNPYLTVFSNMPIYKAE